MKTSTVLASLLFGSMAVAAPLDKRARVTKTEVVTTTVVLTTTIYDDQPAPAPTTSQGLFYEQPQQPSVAPTTSAAAPAKTSAAPVQPSVAAQPPVQDVPKVVVPTSSAAAPAPVIPSVAPPAPAAPSPAAPSPAAPSAAPANPPSSSTGQSYSGVDITVYDAEGGKGACGQDLNDKDIFVALSSGTFGDTTFDRMTGKANNYWCSSRKIRIEYNGKSVTAPVVDRCGDCKYPHDVDLSRGAWAALGLSGNERFSGASWSLIA